MSKENQFRVFGGELREKDGYVDVTVSGIDGEGSVYFSEDNGGREWSLSSEKVSELIDDDLMLPRSAVVTHGLWNRLGDITGERKANVSDPFSDELLGEAQKALFRAAFEETR